MFIIFERSKVGSTLLCFPKYMSVKVSEAQVVRVEVRYLPKSSSSTWCIVMYRGSIFSVYRKQVNIGISE